MQWRRVVIKKHRTTAGPHPKWRASWAGLHDNKPNQSAQHHPSPSWPVLVFTHLSTKNSNPPTIKTTWNTILPNYFSQISDSCTSIYKGKSHWLAGKGITNGRYSILWVEFKHMEQNGEEGKWVRKCWWQCQWGETIIHVGWGRTLN